MEIVGATLFTVTDGGWKDTLRNAYHYGPQITNVTVAKPKTGSTTSIVTIHGKNFAAGTASVDFGGSSAVGTATKNRAGLASGALVNAQGYREGAP